MKLLYCEKCGDIIAPLRANNRARWCICGKHAVWWLDGSRGILRVHDTEDPEAIQYEGWEPAAYVLGINNQFLCYPGEINAFVVRKIDQDCHDDYIFKRIHSPLIRIRPGQSRDTAWARLPKIGEAVEPNH
jgi:hypothetical protein